jgi:AcrR family transcriptional regulator
VTLTAGRSAVASGSEAASTSRGRPRDARIDDAILDATLRLLGDVGYQGMSISAIAEAAGVGRPAIYRRFHSKADLVVAAVLRLNAGPDPVRPAHPREALGALLARTADALTSPGGLATLGSLLAQERRDPELLAAFRRRVFDPRHAVVHSVLRDGIEHGLVAADADLEAVDASLFGAILARAVLGEPVDAAWIDRVIAQAWQGIAAVQPSAVRPATTDNPPTSKDALS